MALVGVLWSNKVGAPTDNYHMNETMIKFSRKNSVKSPPETYNKI